MRVAGVERSEPPETSSWGLAALDHQPHEAPQQFARLLEVWESPLVLIVFHCEPATVLVRAAI
jgi:hypothetical protein